MGGKKARAARSKMRDVATTRVIVHKVAEHAHHLHDKLHPHAAATATGAAAPAATAAATPSSPSSSASSSGSSSNASTATSSPVAATPAAAASATATSPTAATSPTSTAAATASVAPSTSKPVAAAAASPKPNTSAASPIAAPAATAASPKAVALDTAAPVATPLSPVAAAATPTNSKPAATAAAASTPAAATASSSSAGASATSPKPVVAAPAHHAIHVSAHSKSGPHAPHPIRPHANAAGHASRLGVPGSGGAAAKPHAAPSGTILVTKEQFKAAKLAVKAAPPPAADGDDDDPDEAAVRALAKALGQAPPPPIKKKPSTDSAAAAAAAAPAAVERKPVPALSTMTVVASAPIVVPVPEDERHIISAPDPVAIPPPPPANETAEEKAKRLIAQIEARRKYKEGAVARARRVAAKPTAESATKAADAKAPPASGGTSAASPTSAAARAKAAAVAATAASAASSTPTGDGACVANVDADRVEDGQPGPTTFDQNAVRATSGSLSITTSPPAIGDIAAAAAARAAAHTNSSLLNALLLSPASPLSPSPIHASALLNEPHSGGGGGALRGNRAGSVIDGKSSSGVEPLTQAQLQLLMSTPGKSVLLTDPNKSSGQKRSELLTETLSRVFPKRELITLVKQYARHLQVLLIGGEDANGSIAEVEVYDVARNRWSFFDPPIAVEPRTGAVSCVLDGYVYMIGGADPMPTASVERINFDPTVDFQMPWEIRTPMTQARHLAAAVVWNKEIYVFGGSSSERQLASCEVYNPIDDTWTDRKTPMVNARDGFFACALDGKLYVCGGDETMVGCECLDVQHMVKRWDPVPNMNQPHARAGFVFGGKIYVCGGVTLPPTLECFDPESRKWSIIAQLPAARGGMDAVFFDGRYLMMSGGRREKAESGLVEIFDVTVQSAAAPSDPSSSPNPKLARRGSVMVSKKKQAALPTWKSVTGVPGLKKARQWATTVVVDE